jgi:tetratricopeptide (TPR) repeat protein
MQRGRFVVPIVIVVLMVGAVVAAVYFSRPTADSPAIDGAAEADLEGIQAAIDAGNYEEAQADLQAVLEENPDNAEAHFKLGLVHFNMGQYDLAREHFQRSMALDPDRAAAVHHNLGVLAYQLGDMETALQEFQAALEEDPDDSDTHYQLGATYLVQAFPMGAPEPDDALLAKAEAEFERALELAPSKPEALVGLANIQMLQGDMQGAITLLEDAIEQNPTMREALFALGRAYLETGQVGKAKTTLEQFLETNPPQVWAQQARDLLAQLE